jgi:hypothetical protein
MLARAMRGLCLLLLLAACRQENPDWMGPDPSAGGDASSSEGASTDDAATSAEPSTSTASGSGSDSGGPTCDPDTQLPCFGVCTNILEDRKNCGECGNMCTGGDQCIDGVCG